MVCTQYVFVMVFYTEKQCGGHLLNITSVSWKHQLGLPGKVCGKEILGFRGALVSREWGEWTALVHTSWGHPDWCLGGRGRGARRSRRPAAETCPGSKTERFGLVRKTGHFPKERRAKDVTEDSNPFTSTLHVWFPHTLGHCSIPFHSGTIRVTTSKNWVLHNLKEKKKEGIHNKALKDNNLIPLHVHLMRLCLCLMPQFFRCGVLFNWSAPPLWNWLRQSVPRT